MGIYQCKFGKKNAREIEFDTKRFTKSVQEVIREVIIRINVTCKLY
jgi:hypothetical protein